MNRGVIPRRPSDGAILPASDSAHKLKDCFTAHADDAFENTPATLFYVAGSSGWESTLAGRPTVLWNGLFGAQSLEMSAGLSIIGEIAKVYSIEYVTDRADPEESDWRCLEYLQLPASPYVWTDKPTPAHGKRFYREAERVFSLSTLKERQG